MKPFGPSDVCQDRPPARARGFSLIEIIIVVGLLSVIMLGLLLMFDQTQRAFRSSMTQTDVLASGRAVAALLNGAMEQITPSDFGTNTVNFYMTNYGSAALPPLLESLPGDNTQLRTNVLESVYFLSRDNQQWVGTGYMVGTPASGFGSLYRFTTNCPVNQDPVRLFAQYQTNFYMVYTNTDGNLPGYISRLADGVISFTVRAFDTNGYLITNMIGNAVNGTNIVVDAPDDANLGGEARQYIFTGNAVPASVEFNLAVLEDRALARLRAIPADTAAALQRRQLTNQIGVGAVHIFRQRVHVYGLDPTAYEQ